MISVWQKIAIILCAHILSSLSSNTQLVLKFGGFQVTRAIVCGLIMGDMPTALLIGGTFQLMAMGLAGYGGASVPNYNTALWIAVPYAIASGTDNPLELAMTIGVPVATLGIQLDVIAKTVNSYWYHRALKCAENRNYKSMYNTIIVGEYCFGRMFWGTTLPVIIFMLFGEPIVQAIINFMPAWLNTALGVVSGVLPALGMAMLMLYMPVKENFHYMVLGYVLYSYFNQPIMSITLVGAVIAFVTYLRLKRESNGAAGSTAVNVDAGGIGDE